MKNLAHLAVIALLAGGMCGCNKTEVQDFTPSKIANSHKSLSGEPDGNSITLASTRAFERMNLLSVLYEGQPATINYKLASGVAVYNKLNEIFVCKSANGQVVPSNIVPVITGVINDENTYEWAERGITFNPGYSPRQFRNRTEIENASRGVHPEISLSYTGIVYRGRIINTNKQSEIQKPALRSSNAVIKTE